MRRAYEARQKFCLEVDFGAHGLAVRDDDLPLVLAFAVPAVQLDAAAAGEQNLESKVQFSCVLFFL
jgi:hypothetical protein